MEIRICKKIATAERKVLRFAWSAWKLSSKRDNCARSAVVFDQSSLNLLNVLQEIELLLEPENVKENVSENAVRSQLVAKKFVKVCRQVRDISERANRRKFVWTCRKSRRRELEAMAREDSLSHQFQQEVLTRRLAQLSRYSRRLYNRNLFVKSVTAWLSFCSQEQDRRDLRATIFNERTILKRSFAALRHCDDTLRIVLSERRTKRMLHKWSLQAKDAKAGPLGKLVSKTFNAWKQLPLRGYDHYAKYRKKENFSVWRCSGAALEKIHAHFKNLLSD